MEFQVINGYANKDPAFISGITSLKIFILGEAVHNKIVDISCFYEISDDQLINWLNNLRL